MLRTLIFFTLISLVSIQAVEEKNIQSVMKNKVEKVLKVLQTKSYSLDKKEKKSIAIMNDVFSYKTMSKISLGKTWKTLSQREKKQFTLAFEKKLKKSYIDKMKLYTNQKVVSKGIKKVKPNRITLRNDIVGKTDTYTIIYNFFKFKGKKDDWRIYDMKLAGVSIIQTYRKQFKSFLKTKSFTQLLESL
jgi:phospholipid transport system substrate-binding protein